MLSYDPNIYYATKFLIGMPKFFGLNSFKKFILRIKYVSMSLLWHIMWQLHPSVHFDLEILKIKSCDTLKVKIFHYIRKKLGFEILKLWFFYENNWKNMGEFVRCGFYYDSRCDFILHCSLMWLKRLLHQ